MSVDSPAAAASHDRVQREPSPGIHDEAGDRRGPLRMTCESILCLLLAVILFRTFAAEGFMISTGSMAPNLLGFHKRVECPKCHYHFAFGTAWDPEGSRVVGDQPVDHAVCPNCGQSGIDVSQVPRNHGDQLLVYKQAYLWTDPRRWEISVFRNPANPTEAYVKRVVGLPGESLQVQAGDVYINNELARKPLSIQRRMWIPVYDQRFHPKQDPDFGEHWIPLPDTPEADRWQSIGTGFELPQIPAENRVSWMTYRHWVRYGGAYETSVPLASTPEKLDMARVGRAGITVDYERHLLSCYGALTSDIAESLKSLSNDRLFHTAVENLYRESHAGPVTDRYGYNPIEASLEPNAIRDLAFTTRLQILAGTGKFYLQMTDGTSKFLLCLDAGRQTASLYASGNERPLRTGPWTPPNGKANVLLEASLIDGQVAVAMDGREPFESWPFVNGPVNSHSRAPFRFGATGLAVRVHEPCVYRDVYYTAQRARHGVHTPAVLGSDEFFMLGDNSPVSQDSRRWEHPAVRRPLLVGKPFLVHLPSQPARLTIGGRDWMLRMPDFSRIRFLP